MTDREDGFLGRWARLKREARRSEPPKPDASVEAKETTPLPAPEAEVDEEFDLSSLPSLDSLGPGSDFTPFLKAGVPLSLRNAALRKAWVSDPVISTFIEVADYDWDFNAPGYGKLLPTDDVRKLVEKMFSRPETAPEADAAPEPPAEGQGGGEPARIAETEADRSPPEETDGEPAPATSDMADRPRLPQMRRAEMRPTDSGVQEPLPRQVEPGSRDDGGTPAEEVPPRRRRHGGAAPC